MDVDLGCICWVQMLLTRRYLGHFQVGSYRYRSLIEGLHTLQRSFIEAPNLAGVYASSLLIHAPRSFP